MDNHKHNNENANNARKPRGSRIGLLAGLLAELLIGSLAGAVAILLLAPRSGKATRAKL